MSRALAARKKARSIRKRRHSQACWPKKSEKSGPFFRLRRKNGPDFSDFFGQQAWEWRRFRILCVFFVPRAPPTAQVHPCDKRRKSPSGPENPEAKGGAWGTPPAVPGRFARPLYASAARTSGARAVHSQVCPHFCPLASGQKYGLNCVRTRVRRPWGYREMP